MSEQLYIRLGSQVNEAIHWLVWSVQDDEIIASGELPDANQLSTLASRAGNRPVTVLVPGCDVVSKQVAMPPKAGRQFIQALPYALEEEFATDIDELFFAAGDKIEVDGVAKMNVAVVSRLKMQQWLEWLDSAGLICQRILPDYLALPSLEDGVSIMQLGDEWLVKEGSFRGFNVSSENLSNWLNLLADSSKQKNEESHEDEDGNTSKEANKNESIEEKVQAQDVEDQKIELAYYSPIEAFAFNQYEAVEQNYELPMQVLAKSIENKVSSLNLRQGVFELKKETWKYFNIWRNAAIFAVCALIAHLLSVSMETRQTNVQAKNVEKEIRRSFMGVFPNGKRVKTALIKKQMKSKLGEYSSSESGLPFLALLDMTRSSFKDVPDLKLANLKFDAKRSKFTLQAEAENFESFEKFKNSANKQGLEVEQGSLNNSGNKVRGSLSLKVK